MGSISVDRSRLFDCDFSIPKNCLRLTCLPIKSLFRRKIFKKPTLEIDQIAEKTWEIAPARISVSRPAFFLPNQFERVTGSAYTSDPRREMAGGVETVQQATQGYLLKNAWLLDGSIYKGKEKAYVQRRTSRLPQFAVGTEIDRGAIYSHDDGIDFFGLWLTDDCTRYLLAKNEGIPIYSDQPPSPHTVEYEKWLEMKPRRLRNAFLKEVVLFDDSGQTEHKRKRFRAISDKLLSHVKVEPHPGVFILRRSSGKRRIMHNELEVAEYLRERRGFRIVDITVDDVPTIVAACAGAQVIAGVEGSHLIHGVMVLQPGASVLTIQPPDRFCGVIKRTTDRDGQNFGFLVGLPEVGGFRADPEEVERTLDLLPGQQGSLKLRSAQPIHKKQLGESYPNSSVAIF